MEMTYAMDSEQFGLFFGPSPLVILSGDKRIQRTDRQKENKEQQKIKIKRYRERRCENESNHGEMPVAVSHLPRPQVTHVEDRGAPAPPAHFRQLPYTRHYSQQEWPS